ncbi:Not1 N-terminal domain, CCR4-Not complex component-domain-containing protein [Pilobolus umbonatus]|nr:Not1 N-terminal domain, CCR4-Not complex component-domain-containing protein [Pilobolus umbonatus]
MSMKKLQSEIDRLLKKVSEGVTTFENIFDKLHYTTNNNQKDKYEQDLKKEIKKLQRLRDQIKNWLSSNDIKDKRALTENRKLIELQMERFKQVEREMKTKAYSKEGLLQREKMDPKDKEKLDVCDFINNAVDELSRQIENNETEIEHLEGPPNKRSSKKIDHERIQELEQAIEKKKWHINRLELILRLLENDHLPPQRIKDLEETIQYYVENNEGPDFTEDEGIYDELNLDEESNLYDIKTNEIHNRLDSDDNDQNEDECSHDGHPQLSPKSTVDAESMKPSIQEEVEAIAVKGAPLDTIGHPTNDTWKYSQRRSVQQMSTVSAWNEPPKISESSKSTDSKKTFTSKKSDTMDAQLPVSLADLGPSFEAVKTKTIRYQDIQYTNQMLDTSLQHVPDLIDSERPKIYQPRTPYNTPSYYPQQPLAIFDNPDLFDKFDMDTLFYIFYYQQGTYQQYLAAKELKKQSWRFHKKYLTWFQRHEEPKIITEEYEEGTYIYFDYENAWCQRKKAGFRFEYRYLEEA